MKKFLFLSITAASLSVFAGGPPNDQAILETLDSLNEDGYACQRVLPEDFSLRDVPSGGSYNVRLNCEKEGSKEKKYIIKYSVSGSPMARCRTQVAVDIQEDKPAKK